ncbi:MAG TPA: permease-like cell division protein FtsX [Vitreimonas sp.]|nr:permease-like cell division protein FtsX [Vitreimonas sp.]
MNPFTSALIAMRRSPYQTLAAILMVTLTFFVGYCFSLLLVGAEQILKFFETRPQIIAFFELNTDLTNIIEIQEDMKAKPYVEDAKIVTKEDALKLYQEDNKDDPLLLELVTASILPASIEVSGKQIQDLVQIKQDLEAVEQVDEVVFQQDVVESLNNWTSTLRYTGLASIVILGLTSFLIVLIVISMKVTTKRQMIQIMRIIGATRWYITQPFIFEGILYGLVGSLLGWVSMYGMLLYLTPWLNEFLGPINLLPIPIEFFALQLGIGTLIGMFLGSFTGSLAVRRMIKR